jgi:hypothetical protein
MQSLVPGIFIFSITVYVSGHLRNSSISHETIARQKIVLKADDKVIATSETDAKGDFEINFNDIPNTKKYEFFCVNKKDTLHLKTFTSFDGDTPEITIYLNAKK